MGNNKHTQLVDFSNPNADKITSGSTKTMTNNKQQTAVEWLQSIELERDLTLADWKQAKEMEKQQIINATIYGDRFEGSYGLDSEQYYNETYGGGEQ
jgi:hypothetical protein